MNNVSPHLCYTAAAVVIHDGKVLLVKHKKLGLWLPPGGHIEANEYPHVAAERECVEETGVRVVAIPFLQIANSDESQNFPCPFVTNLHWISKANYDSRQAHAAAGGQGTEYTKEAQWQKGCEQHLNYSFMCKVADSANLSGDYKEVDDLAWVTEAELPNYALLPSIRDELKVAFELWPEGT